MDGNFPLPALRQDLRLMRSSPDEDGAPRWLLFDAMRNKYFAISKEAFWLVRHWSPGQSITHFVQQLGAHGHDYNTEEVSAFAHFLIANSLVAERNSQASERLHREYSAQLQGAWRWLLHHYLFIRIPLLRPDPWLARWLPRLEWFFLPRVHYSILALGLIGLLLALRQLDAFMATFLHFLNLEGLVFYGLTLGLVKSAHEFGHAIVAKRLGCRVASMGVALLVLFPVLYTDTTDAWRLRSRAQRLRIVTAGIRVELYLALLATFLWNFLPDGPLRSAAFFVATTSWITSLLVNISPFLRFDGYYAFSDWLGIENLQQRAFSMGRWSLRKQLLGINDPLPEPLPRQRARILILYAWSTWIYRFFLFLGIALLVYHFFFKLLGILLFVVEILWFILLPMLNELKTWWAKRAEVSLNLPRKLGLASCFGLLIALTLPISKDIHIPAVLIAESYQPLYAPEPARVAEVAVRRGDSVQTGQLLIRLESDDLQYEQSRVAEELALIETRLRRSASSVQENDARAILEQQRQRLLERSAGTKARLARFEIRADRAGRVNYIMPLSAGVWVGTQAPLLSIIDPAKTAIEGYLSSPLLERIEVGQQGVFITDTGLNEAIAISLTDIDIGASPALVHPELGAQHGGPIPARQQSPNSPLKPEDSRYRTRFKLLQPDSVPIQQRTPGVAILKAKPHSWLWYQMRHALALLIRESGF